MEGLNSLFASNLLKNRNAGNKKYSYKHDKSFLKFSQQEVKQTGHKQEKHHGFTKHFSNYNTQVTRLTRVGVRAIG